MGWFIGWRKCLERKQKAAGGLLLAFLLLSACVSAEIAATPPPTPTLPLTAILESGAATFKAMVEASATALKLTADAPTSTPTLESMPTTPPTASRSRPTLSGRRWARASSSKFLSRLRPARRSGRRGL